MLDKYSSWIEEHAPEGAYLMGRCKEMSLEMIEAFPELRLARGHYHCAGWGERGHWWCVAPDETIVDPTAAQFPTQGAGIYEELQANAPEPVGKCGNCGKLVFPKEAGYYFGCFCNETCEKACLDALVR